MFLLFDTGFHVSWRFAFSRERPSKTEVKIAIFKGPAQLFCTKRGSGKIADFQRSGATFSHEARFDRPKLR